MGKVLGSFTNGYPGAIARSVDDIVVSHAAGATIPFGVPVVFNPLKTAVVPFASTHTVEDLVGIAVRVPSKTPDAYDSSTAQYNPREMADVLVRGTAVVQCISGTPAPGGAVYIVKANGKFAAEAATAGTDNVLVPHMKWRGAKDSNNRAEVVVLIRNIT